MSLWKIPEVGWSQMKELCNLPGKLYLPAECIFTGFRFLYLLGFFFFRNFPAYHLAYTIFSLVAWSD